MNEQAKKATKRTRRWLKVSLRTFLLAITVLCVWLGFIVNRVNKQKQAVAWVRENGGMVFYDFEGDGEYDIGEDGQYIVWGEAQLPGPKWLREIIGIDYFADVTYVKIHGHEINDLTPLAGMKEIRRLYLQDTNVVDLSPLVGMKHMQRLYLNNTPIEDLSPLTGMNEMKILEMRNTKVSDVSPLSDMTGMINLDLSYTQVSDLSPLAGLTEMKHLDIHGTQVWDLSRLVRMRRVRIHLQKDHQVIVPQEFEWRLMRDNSDRNGTSEIMYRFVDDPR